MLQAEGEPAAPRAVDATYLTWQDPEETCTPGPPGSLEVIAEQDVIVADIPGPGVDADDSTGTLRADRLGRLESLPGTTQIRAQEADEA